MLIRVYFWTENGYLCEDFWGENYLYAMAKFHREYPDALIDCTEVL